MGLSWQLGIFVAIASGAVLKFLVVCSLLVKYRVLSGFTIFVDRRNFQIIRNVIYILRQYVCDLFQLSMCYMKAL